MRVKQQENKTHKYLIFFVKDCITKKELRVEYCPTDKMLADFHTRPLQGSLFYKFCNAIMHIPPHDIHHMSKRSVLEHDDKMCDSEDKADDA